MNAREQIIAGTAPSGLTVGGSLDLSNTQITSLPDNLTVGGWLDLSNTQITSLPDNLTVGGTLDLSGTQITSLPDNLTVGGTLDLSGTQIKFPCRASQKGKFGTALCVCPNEGYTLVAHDDGSYSAGCQDFPDAADALRHWSRSDHRAVLFAKHINDFAKRKASGSHKSGMVKPTNKSSNSCWSQKGEINA
jgi:Leucine-rich repeat (LRR) protein